MANSHRLHEKKIAELKVGWVIAEHLLRNGGKESYVGFPLKPGSEAGEPVPEYALPHLMDHSELIADADYDITLTLNPEDQSDLNRIEITRVAGRPKGEFLDFTSIVRLLKKKYLRQADPKVFLAISVENDCHFDADGVQRFIDSHESPYGQIYLIGKISSEKWIFRLIELYPEQAEFEDFCLA